MANISILKINGSSIRNPMTYEYQRYDMDREEGTGRNQKGTMFRDRAGVKVKLVCEFPPMNDRQISEIYKAIDPVFFEMEYPDAHDGKRLTKTFYVGDRTSPLYVYDDVRDEWIWQGLKVDFIEK